MRRCFYRNGFILLLGTTTEFCLQQAQGSLVRAIQQYRHNEHIVADRRSDLSSVDLASSALKHTMTTMEEYMQAIQYSDDVLSPDNVLIGVRVLIIALVLAKTVLHLI